MPVGCIRLCWLSWSCTAHAEALLHGACMGTGGLFSGTAGKDAVPSQTIICSGKLRQHIGEGSGSTPWGCGRRDIRPDWNSGRFHKAPEFSWFRPDCSISRRKTLSRPGRAGTEASLRCIRRPSVHRGVQCCRPECKGPWE